MFLNN
ncbi:putative hemoglobin and hemoglobin-haptoglobin-binding protein 3 precursor, partial [Haemophilus influenzae]